MSRAPDPRSQSPNGVIMDHVSWTIIASISSMTLGAFIHWLFQRNNCKYCGISELKSEISRLCNLVRALAEKAGMTVKEQLEIENIDR